MIVLVILLMLVIVGGIGAGLFLLVKKLDPMQNDKTENSNLEIAQDFLPFDDIRNGMIIMPNHNYRAVIECSALNYDLKTEGERDQIEMSFQQFINSLNFPISIFNYIRGYVRKQFRQPTHYIRGYGGIGRRVRFRILC